MTGTKCAALPPDNQTPPVQPTFLIGSVMRERPASHTTPAASKLHQVDLGGKSFIKEPLLVLFVQRLPLCQLGTLLRS